MFGEVALQDLSLFDNRLIGCGFFFLLLSFAAAAAKSRQSCPTLCDPTDGSPTGSAIPGILQARTLEWVAISFSSAWKWKVKVKSLSHVQLLSTPWTACSLPGSSVHGIFQPRILEWVAFACSVLSFKSSLYIMAINPISDMWFANIFPHSVVCLFTLLVVSSDIQNFTVFMKSSLLFHLLLVPLVSYPRNHCQTYYCATFALSFLLRVL